VTGWETVLVGMRKRRKEQRKGERVGDATYGEIQLTMEERGCGVLQRAEPCKSNTRMGSSRVLTSRLVRWHRDSKGLVSGAAGRPFLQLPVTGIVYDRLT
jgi:hypothetical protein